jgi:hypothetical protein
MAAASNLGVDGKGKRGTETNNGLVTLNATLEVNNGRINTKKARQAAVVVVETGNS